MSVLHAFPPGVRQALDAMRGDPADELQELAQKLGGSGAETAKRWREIQKLWRASREDVEREARKLRKPSKARQFQDAASPEESQAAREVRRAFEDALEVRCFLEDVHIAKVAAGSDDRPKIESAIRFCGQLAAVLRSLERPDMDALVAQVTGMQDLVPAVLRSAPSVRARHGETERARRFIRTLRELLAARYGEGNKWALVAWVCARLGNGEFTPEQVREMAGPH